MENLRKGPIIVELQRDLAQKYRLHGPKIEELWRSFEKGARTKALKAGAEEGMVLKDPRDRSMGNVYKIIPEFNLRDITEPGSDYLLDILKHRATMSIDNQYFQGVNGGLGDHAFITWSMEVNNLRHIDEFKNGFTVFIDGDMYGMCVRPTGKASLRETMAGFEPAFEAGLCVPQSTGELILERQLYTLQTLNILVEDILDIGSKTRETKVLPKKPEHAALDALSKLSIVQDRGVTSLKSLLDSARDQKSSLDDYLNLCRSEPVFLAHMVNLWFFTRPELVQDERGRILPLITDKYISIAVFEMIHNVVTGAANWDYIRRLLQILDDRPNELVSQTFILQELSNVCHLEYGRAQKLFKRNVQTASGSKYFKRVSGAFDNGVARVTMKGKPDLLKENSQLHHMLQLCRETDASKAAPWIKKIDERHQSHPSDRENMEEREFESFCDLAVITSFIQSLSTILPLPTINPKKGQIYVSKYKELGTELGSVKMEVDLSDFAVPIDNLLEPGMASGSLSALDQFVTEKTGTKMGFLYQDLIELCVSDIEDYLQKIKTQKTKAELPPYIPIIESPTPAVQFEQRRQKYKTRPAQSSIYEITPATTPDKSEAAEPLPTFKVKPATYETFSTLFLKSEARGSITWAAFESAMADVKFSVIPKFGSVFTFLPPQDMGVQQPLTLHRPHKSRIEGHLLLIFASRLRRVYGWGGESFEVV